MAKGDHHHVTIIVGIGIHDDEMVSPSVEYEVLFIPVLSGLGAEDAALRLLAEDVIDPPRCP